MTDTFVNESRVGGQDQNLTGDIIPPGGTGSVLPQSDFMGDVKEHDAKIGVVQGQMAGFAKDAQARGSFVDNQAAERAETYQQEMEHSYSLERASANDPSLKPWNADQEHAARVRGPIEQFGSLGTIFAMAASAFTRQPMVSALNAGAAAMTAMKNSDEEGYKHAFEAWKDNSQLAIKRFDMERIMFDDVNKLATSNVALWRQKRAAIAAQFNDQTTLTLLQNGMDPDVLKLDAQQATTHGKLIENRAQMLQMNREQELYSDYIKAHMPEAKTPLDQLKVKAGALQAVLQARKGGENPEEKFNRMMALETAKEQARSAEGKAAREAAMDRLVATIGSREQIAGLTDERIRELSGNQIDSRERLEKEREAARAAEGDKGRQSRENMAANRLDAAAERANLSNDVRTKIASMNNEARERLQEYLEDGREDRAEMSDKLKRDLSAAGIKAREITAAARASGGPRTLAAEKVDVIEKAKAEFRETNGGREPNATESKDIITKATTGADKPTLSDETQTYMAKQYMQGDKSVLQNLGRGAQGAANLIALREKVMEIAKKENISPVELATRMTEFSGMLAAQRTLGVRTANVEMFNNEAINMMSIARQASRDFPRTQFPAINKAIIAYDSNTGDPKVRAFGAAINEVVNTYSKAINGGNAGTVHDKENARELLKDIDTPEQFEAVLKIMEQGLQQARKAPGQVREELRNLSGGGSTIEQGKVPPTQNVIRYDAQGNRIQ